MYRPSRPFLALSFVCVVALVLFWATVFFDDLLGVDVPLWIELSLLAVGMFGVLLEVYVYVHERRRTDGV
jgi:hypothetical protein